MKEHHLPEFIQSAWSASNADKQLIRYTVSPTPYPTRPLRKAPGAFGYLHDYTAFVDPVPAGVEDKNAFEKATQRLDSDAAIVRDKMLANAPLPPEDYATWTRFLMFMRLREPEMIAYAREESTRVLLEKLAEAPDEYEAAVDGLAVPPTLEEWVRKYRPGIIENAALYFLPAVLNDTAVHKRFFEMPFWVGDFTDIAGKLLLGDRPLLLVNNLADPNAIVIMPLSPKKVFISSPNEYYRRKFLSVPRAELLQRINEETLNRAKEHVFADDETCADIIAETLRRRAAAA